MGKNASWSERGMDVPGHTLKKIATSRPLTLYSLINAIHCSDSVISHKLCERLSPSLFLPLSSTHLSVLVLIIVTLYSLASLKFDYLPSRLSSMPPLDSLLVLPVSLTSPLYDTTTSLASMLSLPALNSKFFSLVLSLNSALLLNTFTITSDPLYLCFLSPQSPLFPTP